MVFRESVGVIISSWSFSPGRTPTSTRGSLGAMANGKAPFDAARAAADGEVLSVLAKLPATGFVAGAESKAAKPAIWTEADKFKKLDQDLVTAAGALATAAKSGDLEQIKAAFGPTAKTCKACHDEFRQK